MFVSLLPSLGVYYPSSSVSFKLFVRAFFKESQWYCSVWKWLNAKNSETTSYFCRLLAFFLWCLPVCCLLYSFIISLCLFTLCWAWGMFKIPNCYWTGFDCFGLLIVFCITLCCLKLKFLRIHGGLVWSTCCWARLILFIFQFALTSQTHLKFQLLAILTALCSWCLLILLLGPTLLPLSDPFRLRLHSQSWIAHNWTTVCSIWPAVLHICQVDFQVNPSETLPDAP